MNSVTSFTRLKSVSGPNRHSTGGRGKRKSILVAGGAGFLGSRLCGRYLEYGCRVICLDNLSTGRIGNLSRFMEDPNFSFVLHDVVDPIKIDSQIDYIFNMACPASPPKYQSDPIQTMKTNLYGAFNLLDLAGRAKARILQASTSEIYGDPEVSPQPEGYQGNVNTVGPRSCYDEGKRAAETIFHEHRECLGIDLRIARIFNAYGPGMDPEDGRVVSNFINQALAGKPITIYGDGSQTRSFCYLEDMVDGLIALMHGPATSFEPMNIGNPDEFTVAELAALVLEKIPSGSEIVHVDLPTDDPKQRRPDICRAQKHLGWFPRVDLDQGLDQTIDYFRAEAEGRHQSVPLMVR